VSKSGIFCVNLLTPGMVELSNRFAGRMPDTERFAGVNHREAGTGAPVLTDALAYLDCKVASALSGNDYTIFIGEVVDCGVPNPEASPLQYLGGKYRRVGEEIT
jgi:flavin reductase (DIM6/NTAB) family NADH-FMN oxidoreductase RutF